MNSRSSQTNLLLQLQLKGWLAFSATLGAAGGFACAGPWDGGRAGIAWDAMKSMDPKSQKQKKVKTNSGSTCRIRVFSFLRMRRSPLAGGWLCGFSSDKGSDPGAMSSEKPGTLAAKGREAPLKDGSELSHPAFLD